MSKLDRVIAILANGERLPEQYKDHQLKGSMAQHHECRMAPDWLLVYKKKEQELILVLVATGTHRDTLNIE